MTQQMMVDTQRTPLTQTWVSLWQVVKLALGSEAGHSGDAPLHFPSNAHSESGLHTLLLPSWLHCAEQHGPWLGLQGTKNTTTTQSVGLERYGKMYCHHYGEFYTIAILRYAYEFKIPFSAI